MNTRAHFSEVVKARYTGTVPIQKMNLTAVISRSLAHNPDKMEQPLQQDGWTKNKKGIYEKNGTGAWVYNHRWQMTRRVDMHKLVNSLKHTGISKGRG